MKKAFVLGISCFLLAGCGDTERVLIEARNGIDGANGVDGLSCVIDGSFLRCGDTFFDLTVLEGTDGKDGVDGLDGQDGASCTAELVGVCISVSCGDAQEFLCPPDCPCDCECEDDPCKKKCNNGNGNGSEGCSPSDNGNDDED